MEGGMGEVGREGGMERGMGGGREGWHEVPLYLTFGLFWSNEDFIT